MALDHSRARARAAARRGGARRRTSRRRRCGAQRTAAPAGDRAAARSAPVAALPARGARADRAAHRRSRPRRCPRPCASAPGADQPSQPAVGASWSRSRTDDQRPCPPGRARRPRGEIRMTTTAADPTAQFTDDQLALQQRAREFVDTVLIPLEQRAEAGHGRLDDETVTRIQQAAIAANLHGGRIPASRGGQGWSMTEWFLVNEQFGRCTNGIHWWVPNVYNVWADATEAQFERYVPAALAGHGGDAYAVTEAEAGSDSAGIASTATRDGDGYRINGEKWFVTSGDVARVLIVMVNVIDGDRK